MTPEDRHDRRIESEIEVPATPQQAWEAIATGPGITAWFMPAEVEGRVGGTVTHWHDGETASTGEVIAHDPPHRFGYAEEWVPGEPPLATEFLVEARSGGTCVVRIVMSGLGHGDDWEQAIDSFSSGWAQALLSLRLYLEHFRGEPLGAVTASGGATGDKAAVWDRLVGALGLPGEPAIGDEVAASGEGVPPLAGTVAGVDDGMLTLLLDAPARGTGFVGAGGPGEEIFLFVRMQLFGDDAAAVAEREEAAWKDWFARTLGVAASAQPS